MIKAIVIDDEKNQRELLIHLLTEHCSGEVEIVGEANSMDSGLELIQEISPELIFLDIQLSGKTGFDLLDRIENLTGEVVFVTAYNDYALKAFEYSAFGYLLKPIKVEKLLDCVARVKKLLSPDNQNLAIRYDILREVLQKKDELKRIVVSDVNGFEVIEFDGIVRMESDNVYTKIYLTNGSTVVSSKSIKHYEKLLREAQFLRVHQRHIVNLNKVHKYLRGQAGNLKMFDNSVVPISRSRKKAVMDRFNAS